MESPGQPPAARRIGRVVDRGRWLQDGPELPAPAVSLDELLLIVRRDAPLRAEPALGFHLYGADLCLQARERGLAVVVLGALCHHNSRSLGLPEAFFASAEVFARKWAHRLPVATPCVLFDREGRVFVLGNAEPGTSLACARGAPLARRVRSAAQPQPEGPRMAHQHGADGEVLGPRITRPTRIRTPLGSSFPIHVRPGNPW